MLMQAHRRGIERLIAPECWEQDRKDAAGQTGELLTYCTVNHLDCRDYVKPFSVECFHISHNVHSQHPHLYMHTLHCMGVHAPEHSGTKEVWSFSFLLLIAEMKKGTLWVFQTNKKKKSLLMASGFEIHWSSGDCFQSAEMESFHCNNNIPY